MQHLLRILPLTPFTANQYWTASMSCAVISISTALQVPPESSVSLLVKFRREHLLRGQKDYKDFKKSKIIFKKYDKYVGVGEVHTCAGSASSARPTEILPSR